MNRNIQEKFGGDDDGQEGKKIPKPWRLICLARSLCQPEREREQREKVEGSGGNDGFD